jgi:hypothetical protein
MKLRQLTSAEIEKLASRKGVKRIAVENFLSSMGDDEMYAGMNVSQDAHAYGWNYATVGAIREGIRMAATGGGKMKNHPLGGLWKVQYAPREKMMLSAISPKERARWKSFSLARKILIIDRLQDKGAFDRYGGAKCGKGWHGQRLKHRIAAMKRR